MVSQLTLAFKGKVLKSFPIVKGSMFIGNSPECLIHIDSLALQPQHARIDTVDQFSILRDLDTPDGTFVNQERINSDITLKDGDLIRVGKHTLSYHYEEVPDQEIQTEETLMETVVMAPTAKPVSNSKQTGWIQILNGQNLGKTVSLSRPVTNLGKTGVATAVIARRSDGYFLSHLEGKYPPMVNDNPIGDDSVKLNDGATIQIGNIKMQFFYE